MTSNEIQKIVSEIVKTPEELCSLLDAIPRAIDENKLAEPKGTLEDRLKSDEGSDWALWDTCADKIYDLAETIGDFWSIKGTDNPISSESPKVTSPPQQPPE